MSKNSNMPPRADADVDEQRSAALILTVTLLLCVRSRTASTARNASSTRLPSAGARGSRRCGDRQAMTTTMMMAMAMMTVMMMEVRPPTSLPFAAEAADKVPAEANAGRGGGWPGVEVSATKAAALMGRVSSRRDGKLGFDDFSAIAEMEVRLVMMPMMLMTTTLVMMLVMMLVVVTMTLMAMMMVMVMMKMAMTMVMVMTVMLIW